MKLQPRGFVPSDAARLVRQGLPPFLARLYAARGVADWSASPSLAPADSMLNALRAAEHLVEAYARAERILVVADYDADGATACTVVVRTLRAWGANVGYLVPNRAVHGYGLSPSIVELAASLTPRPNLLVTVDNGIASYAGVDAANSAGMRVLVTDHHLPAAGTQGLPDAVCIVNPNQPGDGFVSRNLAGCGVAWYVCSLFDAIMRERGRRPTQARFTPEELLPFVALGTIADVVALDGNNRELVRRGLAQIRDGRCPVGLHELARLAKSNLDQLSCSDIAFTIAPKLNAAGRLDDMSLGIECLLSDEQGHAEHLASQLHELNQQRKDIEKLAVDEATVMALDRVTPGSRGVALYDAQWHEGVIGIVAGRIREKTARPTFICTLSHDGSVKGSGRSIPGFHLRDALDLVAKRDDSVLQKFGGHAMAAGVTIAPGKFERFAELFEQIAGELIPEEMLLQVTEVDGSLEPHEMSLDNAITLKHGIWGQGFLEPVFLDDFTLKGYRRLGADKLTLRLDLERAGRSFTAVHFRSEIGELTPGQPITLAYSLEPNYWNDRVSLQLMARQVVVQ